MKRVTDVLVAGAGVVVLAFPMALIALAIVLAMGRPVLFAQLRAGRAGRPFPLLKFRTMTAEVDAAGRPLSDGQRLTRFGRFLRRTSLDELPQLINVLRGDMSLVGPRPLLPEYMPMYSAHHARRHEVTPGITGWAQVNGRNGLRWSDRLELDVWYVAHRNWRVDAEILVRTPRAILSGVGVSHPGHATMEPYRG